MTLDLDAPRRSLPWSGRIALAVALALTVGGVASIHAGEGGPGGSLTLTKTQAVYAVVGLAAMAAAAGIGHVRLGRAAYPLFGLMLVLLALLVLAHKISLDPIIPLKRKTARWVQLGPLGFQPSEYAKVVYVLALARYLKFRSNYRTLRGLIVPFLLTLIPTALILVEPDLGTALLFLPVLMVMLFAAGARIRHLIIVLGLGLAAMPAFFYSPLMSPYQKQRIEALFRQADADPRWQMGPGYQLHQSKVAIGSGGWLGQPLSATAFFRHDMLPEEQNDFIFAVIGHQWGFAGASLAVGVYVLLVAAGFSAASATNDPFTRLVAVGVTAMIGVQTLINIGMTIGLTPVTGITLPFVSSGGSSLVANFLAVGLLLSAARHRPILIAHKPFEFLDDDAAT